MAGAAVSAYQEQPEQAVLAAAVTAARMPMALRVRLTQAVAAVAAAQVEAHSALAALVAPAWSLFQLPYQIIRAFILAPPCCPLAEAML